MVNYNIGFFGDDYYYLTYTQGTFKDFITNHINHYTQINGRFIVHILVTIFLYLDLFWWRIINSLMLSGIVYFGAKIASYKNSNNISTFFPSLIFFCSICLLNISLTRQSVYWLTGSFNYVYPIFILLVFWYKFIKYIDTKKRFGFTLFLAFLSSASVEQAALMSIGLIILTNLLNIFFKKWNTLEKLGGYKMVILTGVAVLGMAFVIFAPSTFIRFKLENSENLPLIVSMKNNFRFIVNVFLFSKILLPYNLLLMTSSVLILFRYINSNKKRLAIISIILILITIPIYLINVYLISDASLFSFHKIIFALITISSYFCIFILMPIILFYIKDFKNYDNLIIAEFLCFGSQIMIIIFPVYGYRNIIFGIILLVLFIAILVSNLDISKSLKYVNLFLSLLLLTAAIINVYNTVQGYSITAMERKYNFEILQNNRDDFLYLYTLPNDDYGWSMPYYSKYHEYYFKKFYKIDKEIIWK
jgi:hypothetical protein